MKKLPFLPDRLPLWLDLIKWIWFTAFAAHYTSIRNPGKQEKKLEFTRILVSRFHLIRDQAFVRNAQRA
jgi:hypothetical protein